VWLGERACVRACLCVCLLSIICSFGTKGVPLLTVVLLEQSRSLYSPLFRWKYEGVCVGGRHRYYCIVKRAL
jgi:hypothetical protein